MIADFMQLFFHLLQFGCSKLAAEGTILAGACETENKRQREVIVPRL